VAVCAEPRHPAFSGTQTNDNPPASGRVVDARMSQITAGLEVFGVAEYSGT